MAGQIVTEADLAATLGLTSDVLQAELNKISNSPAELASHMVKREYLMTGLTPNDFASKHAGTEIDYSVLQAEFKAFCPDYLEPLRWDEPSMAIEFCSKIIYEVVPESRQVKKADGEKVWKFKFSSAYNNTAIVKVVFVATFKADKGNFKKTTDNKMILTVKEANLIAMDTFHKIVEAAYTQNSMILLTPIAGAVFSGTDLTNLAAALGLQMIDLLVELNSSCQSGGHLLPNSTGECGAVASLLVTRNVQDKKVRAGIVNKNIKQFFAKEKTIDMVRFKIFEQFAHGGVLLGFDMDTLDQEIANIQQQKISPRRAANILRQSVVSGIVPAPFQTGQAPPAVPSKTGGVSSGTTI